FGYTAKHSDPRLPPMIVLSEIDPVAVALGPLKIRWYALTYLFGFAMAWWLGTVRAKRPGSGWTTQQVADLVTNGMLGVILGGRLGYVLFYDLDSYLAEPLRVFKVWEGGMSFHGALIGVIITVIVYARSIGKNPMEVLDFVAPLAPIGLGAGRVGNFINGELWGRVTDVPWAMVFPRDPTQLPRHPSQLYQLVLEGIALFVLLWWYSSKPRPRFAVGGMFMLGYGLQRTLVEFVRQPDAQLNFVMFDWMTRGQQLSIPMMLIGIGILVWAYRQQPKT
ncbi:MAG TPA: prolipoprotein diacylglyceryl transferase, partial [Candidatus Acidoferrum sp.]|nr:prolipoprotein diacylglyceryl transferase [Candidatus Acidoferrum sp.]